MSERLAIVDGRTTNGTRKLSSRARGLVCVGALTLGLAACGGSDPTTSTSSQTLHVATLAASKGTAARFKVTRWHLIEQKDADTFVVDGSDATGKVLLSASFKTTDSTYEVTSYATKGKLVYDRKTKKVVSNTLGLKYARLTNAFLLDKARAGVGYGIGSKLFSAGKALFKRVFTKENAKTAVKEVGKAVAVDAAVEGAKALAEKATQAKAKAQQNPTPANEKAANDAQAAADKAQQNADEAQKNQSAEESAQTPEEDKNEAQQEQDALDDQVKDDAEADQTAEADAQAEADELNADPEATQEEKDEAAADLEDATGEADESEADAQGIDDAEAQGDAEEEPAEDPGDDGSGGDDDASEGDALPDDSDGSESLDEGNIDDSGSDGSDGSDEATEATRTCKKTSCSKTTRICVCAHY